MICHSRQVPTSTDRIFYLTNPPHLVEERISGPITSIMLPKQAKRYFGRWAYQTWVSMLWNRDEITGLTSITNARLAEISSRFGHPLCLRQIRRAVQRLKRIGLVAFVGRQLREGGKRLMTRQVFGDLRSKLVIIPLEVKIKVNKLPKRGGKRPGSGRKPKPVIGVADTQQPVESTSDSQPHPKTNNASVDKTNSPKKQNPIEVKSSGCEETSETKTGSVYFQNRSIMETKRETKRASSLIREEGAEVGAVSELRSGSQKQTGSISISKLGKPTTISKPPSTLNSVSISNTKHLPSTTQARPAPLSRSKPTTTPPAIQPAVSPAFVLDRYHRAEVIPPSPNVSYIGNARVPPPPKLNPKDPIDQRVLMLAKAYAGAVESRFHEKTWPFGRGDLVDYKHWDLMVEAVEALQALEIAPAAWAAWSCDVWKYYGAKTERSSAPRTTPPPVKWVWSPKRLEERHGWFLTEASAYCGGKLIFSEAHKDALGKHKAMDRDLRKPAPSWVKDNASAKECTYEIIEKWFPGGWWPIYEKIVAKAQDDQARINKMVLRGEFIW